MSALSFARQAFGREKPHSSITDWVDILTAPGIQDEAYDGIPELVESISLQASGPTEASRALRKKLKHGNAHQQFRALVILKALVENCGTKFSSTFADGHMTDALKFLANDPTVDKRVKKKVVLVLGSWRDQYIDDPSMSVVAGLYKHCRPDVKLSNHEMVDVLGLQQPPSEDKKRKEKEAKEERNKARKTKDERAKEGEDKRHPKRIPFNFERDKPKVLASIVDASQASSNLVNAITLVNLATDSLETNERVQECLIKAREVRKPVIRFIQLVENEEVIGTLIETNDRIMAALEMYDKLSESPNVDSANALSANLASTTINSSDNNTPLNPIYNQEEKGKNRNTEQLDVVHPDLEDLNFGPLGNTSANLPPPLRPSALSDEGEQDINEHRGSLSDYSDYESSDEETHRRKAGTSFKRNYVTVSDIEDDASKSSNRAKSTFGDDPFAD